MSKYLAEQEKRGQKPVSEPKVDRGTEFGIRDTEFLIRLIMSSKIDGADIEVAASVTKKIKELHASIIGHTVRI